MTRADAVANVRTLRTRLRLLTDKVNDRPLALLAEVECSGRQVHDANVVATMIAHGTGTIATANVADFTRFGDWITVIGLAG